MGTTVVVLIVFFMLLLFTMGGIGLWYYLDSEDDLEDDLDDPTVDATGGTDSGGGGIDSGSGGIDSGSGGTGGELYTNYGENSVYESYPGQSCGSRNEIGEWSNTFTEDECGEMCNYNPNCLSYEYNTSGKCQLSTSCNETYMSTNDPWTLYVKRSDSGISNSNADFVKYGYMACNDKNNIMDSTAGFSLDACALSCYDNPSCTSFEYGTEMGGHTNRCQMSSECTTGNMTDTRTWDLYMKQ